MHLYAEAVVHGLHTSVTMILLVSTHHYFKGVAKIKNGSVSGSIFNSIEKVVHVNHNYRNLQSPGTVCGFLKTFHRMLVTAGSVLLSRFTS